MCRHLDPAGNVFADRFALDAHLPGDHGDLYHLVMQVQDDHQFSKLLHRGIVTQQDGYGGCFQFDPVQGASNKAKQTKWGIPKFHFWGILICKRHFGRAAAIIKQRERIKQETIEYRRLRYRKLAA